MIKIPYRYSKSIVLFNWGDIEWGCQNEIIEWKDAVEFALQQIDDTIDLTVMELALIDPKHTFDIMALVKTIADKSPFFESSSKRRWLYVALSWIYEGRAEFSDPLGIVEELYADFDYPSDLEPIVRYMPQKDGYDARNFTFEQNEQRLFEKWKKIINHWDWDVPGTLRN